MSETRVTRSKGAVVNPRAASPKRKKKNNDTGTSVEGVNDVGGDTGGDVEGKQSNTSTASTQQAFLSMAQMLAQQQQQLTLLSQLAQQHHSALAQGGTSAAVRPITGLTPKGAFDRRYKGEGGATLDDWISHATQMLAFYSGLTTTQAAVWLSTGLEGAALAWYQSSFKHQPPASGGALFDALRSRFQLINSEETTRYELATLKQGPKQSVDEYSTRFLHLISLLPDETVASRIFQFRLGLHRVVDDRIRQGATQPTTLQETIAMAARIEGRSGSSSSENVSNMEMDSVAAMSARLAALEQSNRILVAGNREQQQQQQTDSRMRDRGAHKGSRFTPAWQRIPGMTKELADKRYAAHECLYCSGKDHTMRDCIDRVSKRPPRLN